MKIEFAMTGILMGIAVGLVAGFAIGIATRQSTLMLQVCAISGGLAGTVFELARFWWRKSSTNQPHEPLKSS